MLDPAIMMIYLKFLLPIGDNFYKCYINLIPLFSNTNNLVLVYVCIVILNTFLIKLKIIIATLNLNITNRK